MFTLISMMCVHLMEDFAVQMCRDIMILWEWDNEQK